MPGTSLGTLTLDLAVRLSEFTDGLTRAERETRDRTENMGNSVAKFKDQMIEDLSGTPIGGAIASLNEKLGSISEAFGESGLAGAAAIGAASVIGSVVAIGAGLVTLALQTAAADEQLERLAKRANTSTANLQVLTAATAKYGLEMEGVGDILADAQEKLGEFSANGGGGLVDTLELMQEATKKTDAELEIFGKSLSTMDSVDAIQAVVDEMELAGATTQEVRFVTESLASGLGDIIPLWDNNGEALRNYERDLNQAGVIRTKESIEQSKILAKEVEGLKVEFAGMSNELVTATLPAMVGLIEYMKRGTTDADGLSSSLSSMGLVAATIATPFIGLMSVFKQVGAVVAGLMGSISSLFSLMSNVLSNPFKIGTYLQEYARSTGQLGQYVIADMKAERDRAVSSLNTIFSSPRELANRRTGLASMVPGGSVASYRNGAVDAEIVATRAMAAAEEEAAKAQEKSAKANEKNTKTIKDQAKAKERLVGISGDTGVGNAHLHIQYRDKSRAVSKADRDRFSVGGRSLDSYSMTSGYGKRNTGIKGASTYHRGTDYGVGKNTPITTTVPVKDVKTWFDKNGGGYVSTIAFEDGVTIDLLHQMPGIMGLDKGPSTGNSSIDTANGKARALQQRAAADAQREQERLAAEALRWQEAIERAQLSIANQYASDKEKIELDHIARVESIEEAYAEGSAERAEYMAREEARYAKEKNAAALSIMQKYQSEEERIHAKHQKALKEIEAANIKDDSVRQMYVDMQNAAYQEDLENFKFASQAKQREQDKLYQSIANSAKANGINALSTGKDSMMQRTLGSEEYQEWRLNQDYVEGFDSINNQYKSRESEINAVDDRGNPAFNDLERYELLEIAKQEHLDKMWALEQEYALKDKTLAEQQAAQRVALYQRLFSGISGLTKAFFGEQSGAYRAMFAIEKGFAIASAALSIKESIGKAMAAGVTPVDKAAYVAEAVASGTTLMSDIASITAPAGIAHGGLDYVPKESTYLLDKGERVLSPRQNRDLVEFMSNKEGSASKTGLGNVNVIVNNHTNADVQTSRNQKGELELKIIEVINKHVPSQLSNPSSGIGKSLKNNWQTEPRR